MAISPKPKKSENHTQKTSGVREQEIKSLIEKGGSVADLERKEVSDNEVKKIVPVSLRIPHDIAERIATAIAERPIKTPRHTWILEAILEKLEKEVI